MAHFVLKYKLKGRPNRARPDEKVERTTVVMGSRPLAEIYSNDRLMAQEAVSFTFSGRGLSVDVIANLAGVFVDGHPVEGQTPVQSGSVVQVGHTMVEVDVDAENGVCTLSCSEQYMPSVVEGVVKKAKPEKPFALVDPGPQEHRWGKTEILFRWSWAAAALGVLSLLAFPFVRNTHAMNRGELASPHEPGSGPDAPASCADCHSPFSSDYGAACARCHEGFASQETHPGAMAGDVSCARCHGEHRGADVVNLMPPGHVESLASGEWPEACTFCHDAYTEGQLKGLVDRARTNMRDRPGEQVDRWLLVDGFSHADHRIAGGRRGVGVTASPPRDDTLPVSCEKCHLPASDATRPAPTAEFGLVSYEQCLECHADWRVEIHGRDEDGAACYACHEKAADPDAITEAIRQVQLPVTDRAYVLRPRGHDFSADECLDCHAGPGSGSDAVTKVFRHDHHLRTVSPVPGTEIALSEVCRTCHTGVADSTTLDGTPLVDSTWQSVDTAGCVTCHTESEPVAVPLERSELRTVTDIFHRVHTVDPAAVSRGALRSRGQRDTLARGCLSCHEPVAGTETMTLTEGARDCKACHTGHENVGEGRCVLCHVDRTPGVNTLPDGGLTFRFNEPGIFNREKATVKRTATVTDFDHESPGHVGHDCAECHDPALVDPSTRVLDVPWPRHDEASCVACHMRERYHR